jgi:hypothetical protein
MALEITSQYLYTGRGPFDAKSLVKTYTDLLSEKTWVSSAGNNIAYNGMVVAVWLNKDDTSKNGIYYLYDKNVLDNPAAAYIVPAPDVTKEENWHKVAEMSDLEAFTKALSGRLDKLEEVELFQKIESDTELPNNFDLEEFNPNITYYRIHQLDPDNTDNYILYTYIYDKDAKRYIRKANANNASKSVSDIEVGDEGDITVLYSDGTSKTISVGSSNVDLSNYATKEYVEEYVDGEFAEFTESLKTTILFGGDSDPNDD